MKLNIVGFGPGALSYMTQEAIEAIKEADVIVGYSTYIAIVKEYFPEKEYFETAMKKEVDRCRWAIEETLKGRNVALVCSGDSGIYGLAGLIYELTKDYPPFEIDVVAGVTAACSGGSVLGAPLTHDFAVISLSDLLTPWEVIEERVRMASKADFVVCLYNPSSKKRHDYLQKACDMMLEYKKKETVCGYVRNIGREGEEYRLCTLEELREVSVDMFTTVFVGNSNTKNINNKMVTPRGYNV